MSEQNNAADAPEEQGSFGSVPSTVGATSGSSEQVGSAPTAHETVGTAPPPAPGGPVTSGGPGTPPDAGAPGAQAPEPKKGNTAVAWIVGAIVVIALALGVGWLFARNNVNTFKVGDCLSAEANSSSDASKVKKVDCDSQQAAVKVVGVVDGLSRAEFDATEPPCQAYEEAQSALWIGTTGKGKTYCLEPVKEEK